MRSDELMERIGEFLQTSTPVTFYDALHLVRVHRALPTHGAEVALLGLVALLDELATDGATKILSDYLQGIAKQRNRQHELARRTVLLRDSGKTARLGVSEHVRVELEERHLSGMRWTLDTLTGPFTIDALPSGGSGPPRAPFLIRSSGVPGTGRVLLRETRFSVGDELRAKSQRSTAVERRFELELIAEANTLQLKP